MKKIIAGIIGLLLVVGVTSGAAYALFFSTVKVNNVAISAGTSGLEFSTNGEDWYTDFTFPDLLAENVAPGYHDHATFYLKNTSSADIKLALKARLVSAPEGWSVFANNMTVWLGNSAGSQGSGYFTLTDWNSVERDLNITIPKGDTADMGIYVDIPSTVGNDIAGQTLRTNWEITGTQVFP